MVTAKIAANIRGGFRITSFWITAFWITSMECAARQHSLHRRLNQEEGAANRKNCHPAQNASNFNPIVF
jgi:hypothetical protein